MQVERGTIPLCLREHIGHPNSCVLLFGESQAGDKLVGYPSFGKIHLEVHTIDKLVDGPADSSFFILAKK